MSASFLAQDFDSFKDKCLGGSFLILDDKTIKLRNKRKSDNILGISYDTAKHIICIIVLYPMSNLYP